MGRKTLRTVGRIMTDIAEREDVSAGDIVSKHVSKSAQILINNLRCRGSKRTREAGDKNRGPKKGQKSRDINRIKRVPRKIIKRDIFSYFYFSNPSAARHVCCRGDGVF